MPLHDESAEPFGAAVRGLVMEDADLLTSTGNVNWTAVADKIGIGYDTLRKAVSGERLPSVEVMAEVADGLGVPTSYFSEYRLWETQRQFDVKEVGYDAAIANLRAWASSQKR
jgi:transcriptional regulator with XRE-family HTH domain